MVPAEFQRYIARNRRTAFAGVVILALAAFFWWDANTKKTWTLSMTGGDELGTRHQLAEILAYHAQARGVTIKLRPTFGSEEAIRLVDSGELDLAMIQGGMPATPNVRQVTSLYPEPLHLFVRPEIEPLGMAGLQGKRVNLGTAGSGTRKLASQVMAFAGLNAETDFVDESASYEALQAMPPEELPDAVFAVLSLPADLASWFVRERGYRLLEIPFAEGLALRDFTVSGATIPLMTYSVAPPVPPRELRTVGNQLLIVANSNVPPEAVDELLEAVYDGAFARSANIPAITNQALGRLPEFVLHPGSLEYRQRKEPILTSETIDNIESMRSFVVSLAVAGFLFWRWYSRRHAVGFEKYINEVSEIEKQAIRIEAAETFDLGEARRLRARLGELKTKAIDEFALGVLKGEELMHSFLVHVTDVRTFLNSLILYERERRDEVALARESEGEDSVER